MNEFLNAMGAARYLAHSLCLTADPVLLFLYTLADLSTALSYFAIGITLMFLARVMLKCSPEHVSDLMREFLHDRQRLITYLILFALFIGLCGLSHFTMWLTLHWGVYRLDIMVRAAMGAVSLSTALLVVTDALGLRARK
jgi:hypothetical protein